MNETILKMGMAGFFHDIGKFADNDTLGVSDKYFNDNAGLYLPFHEGRYTHHHALYTASFIEQMKNLLPQELNSHSWGEGDAFINLAAGHHNPETPMQQIITAADWLTSGIDRHKFESEESKAIAVKDYKKTRLLPIFEQLDRPPKEDAEEFVYEYPLNRLSPLGIFPETKNRKKIREAKEEYVELFNQFVQDLQSLRSKDENLRLWFEHFDNLMMVYTSCIPSARVGRVVHDVSLYDHSRLTAAFAAVLYAYHASTGSLNTRAISNDEEEKFLMVSGNFYGIQNFIFSSHGDTRKYRAKILRGRSFYVSLLTEVAADRLCMEIGIPHICVIFNAAGKFTVLCPNTETANAALETVRDQVNDWLCKVSFGEVAMGLSALPAAQKDFFPPRFQELWDGMAAAGDENKFHKIDLDRHGGVVKGYLDTFRNDLARPLCPLCGKRAAAVETGKIQGEEGIGPVCTICRDQVFLGTRIVRDNEIIILKAASGAKDEGELTEPLLGCYQLRFVGSGQKERTEREDIRKHWDISIFAEREGREEVCRKLLNRYVPRYQEGDHHFLSLLTSTNSRQNANEIIEEIDVGDPLPFHLISLKSRNLQEGDKILGLDALGILKADVDNLGMLMACGLQPERFTISRIATLSRQLNYYFALYLPHLLMTDKQYQDVYTVFAGGDDLFVIGPWNAIYALSLHIHDTFAAYTCENKAIHLSAGIALKKPNAPLGTLAESAEAALESSKSAGRDCFTMFEETVPWENVKTLEEIRVTLEDWYQKKWVNKSMLYRLNGFIALAEEAQSLVDKTEISMAEMSCLKWRALFSYAAGRNLAKDVRDHEERERIVNELRSTMAEWFDTFGGKLRIPLWNILYNYR
ncbi:MAG: type III-A CRISPR-associated protein Cas10/Csm1 [Desulfatiglandales bacterium]